MEFALRVTARGATRVHSIGREGMGPYEKAKLGKRTQGAGTANLGGCDPVDEVCPEERGGAVGTVGYGRKIVRGVRPSFAPRAHGLRP